MLVTSSSPKVTGMYDGDYWIWTIPVHNAAANTNVACEFSFMGTDAGGKYHIFEWAQCTSDEYAIGDTPIIMMTDAEKRKFYDSLDWTQWNLVDLDVPNDVDVARFCFITTGLLEGYYYPLRGLYGWSFITRLHN